MMFNPMIQQYADAFKTQMDYETNKAVQGGLLNLNSYKPAIQTQQNQVTPVNQSMPEKTLGERLMAGEDWNSVMGK